MPPSSPRDRGIARSSTRPEHLKHHRKEPRHHVPSVVHYQRVRPSHSWPVDHSIRRVCHHPDHQKLRLPNVTGYILSGVLIGPYVLDLIPGEIVEHMEFVTDVALAFIAFGVGRYFKLSTLRASGSKIVILTLFESLAAAVLVTASMALIFHLPMPFCLLLGAIGSATAPASTIMTIRQYQAKGEFVNTILQVVALDDAVALIAFSVCAAVVSAMEDSSKALDFGVVILPVILNAVTVIAGGALGYVLHRLIDNERRSSDHRLILTTAILLFITGFCTCFDISPLLSCMALGAVYTNVSDNDRVFTQVNSFTPPILLMFFVLSGMRLNLPSLATAGVIGIFYFFIRILGKYTGAYAGARICGYSANIRNYLGLALIPQAGVSIGLAVLGQRLLSPETGLMLSTIILSSGVLYEMVGPACAKASLFLSHTIEKEDAHPVQQEGAAHN